MDARWIYPRTPPGLLRAAIICDVLAGTLWIVGIHYQRDIYDHFDNAALGRLWIPVACAAGCGLVLAGAAFRRAVRQHFAAASMFAGLVAGVSAVLLFWSLIFGSDLMIKEFSNIAFF